MVTSKLDIEKGSHVRRRVFASAAAKLNEKIRVKI